MTFVYYLFLSLLFTCFMTYNCLLSFTFVLFFSYTSFVYNPLYAHIHSIMYIYVFIVSYNHVHLIKSDFFFFAVNLQILYIYIYLFKFNGVFLLQIPFVSDPCYAFVSNCFSLCHPFPDTCTFNHNINICL